jgi:hypothetical protein
MDGESTVAAQWINLRSDPPSFWEWEKIKETARGNGL